MAQYSTHSHLTLRQPAYPRCPRWLVFPCLLLSLLIVGCGNRPPEITPTTREADRLLFERGTEALEEEDWLRARQYFTELRDNYPQSGYRAEARLGLGDTFEGEGSSESYVSALDEYRNFLALYPTHERADYAQYKLGTVYFHQMRRPERDQSQTRNAVSEFELFVQRYPGSALMSEVRANLREARDQLSEANFIVGRFYYRNKWYPGAIDRFKMILDEDPGYSDRDEVYFHLADAYRETGQTEEALPLFERLVEEFPETEHIERATEHITELKLRPPQDEDKP